MSLFTGTLNVDEIPWVEVARKILAGNFDAGMDAAMRESLEIGLRSVQHPLCRDAEKHLARKKRN